MQDNPPTTLLTWHAHWQSGPTNMARDAALLTWCQQQPHPVWILHTYCWQPATLSVGVHQSQASIQQAVTNLPEDANRSKAVVRRPTGGRAIPHGADISVAIITNHLPTVQAPLAQRYASLTQPLLSALTAIGITIEGYTGADNTAPNAYAAHSLCFSSHTPWDIKDTQGHKIAGCAQTVQKNGILQHGAVFLPNTLPDESLNKPDLSAYQQLAQALTKTTQAQLQSLLGTAITASKFDASDTHWQQTYTEQYQHTANESAELSQLLLQPITP